MVRRGRRWDRVNGLAGVAVMARHFHTHAPDGAYLPYWEVVSCRQLGEEEHWPCQWDKHPLLGPVATWQVEAREYNAAGFYYWCDDCHQREWGALGLAVVL